MQFGLPNVTSTVGAEAMHENFDWNGFITDNETEFVEKAVLLYQDENIWQKSQENGYLIVENLFKKEIFEEISSKNRLDFRTFTEHRNTNFLGQILQHHTLQSTKYLSKWIEEKNSKNQ
jgi:hypothetical protein